MSILFARNGGFVRACSRWRTRDDGDWFGDEALSERSRFQRLRAPYHNWCDARLTDPTFCAVSDSYPIDRLVPIRHGRRPRDLGNNGRGTGRWRVGIARCWPASDRRRIVAWDWDAMNASDTRRNRMVAPVIGATMALANDGCRDQHGVPENMQACKHGARNGRVCVETALSMVAVIGDVTRIRRRLAASVQARLAFVAAMFNTRMDVFHTIHPDAAPRRCASPSALSERAPKVRRMQHGRMRHRPPLQPCNVDNRHAALHPKRAPIVATTDTTRSRSPNERFVIAAPYPDDA